MAVLGLGLTSVCMLWTGESDTGVDRDGRVATKVLSRQAESVLVHTKGDPERSPLDLSGSEVASVAVESAAR